MEAPPPKIHGTRDILGFGVALLIAWGPAILGVVLFSGAFALAVKAIMIVFWLIASWTGHDDDAP